MSTYIEREQTQAKHFILRGYLQELAFKVLHGWDIAYIDGFSGPWKSEAGDFSDTSFMIAISVLTEAQCIVSQQVGVRRKVKCFFVEKDLDAYRQMVAAVAGFHQVDQGFEIATYNGEFVEAVDQIRAFVGRSFPLIFIDPTGWTEYPLGKIAPLFALEKCEVLINFMYGHISRFISHPDDRIIASLDPILGGTGWKSRLDPSMRPGLAVEKLFRETLKREGKFAYVVSTRIDKSTQERPHFFIVYGTKNRAGLKAFRETEYKALRAHARSRSAALTRKRERRSGSTELFADHDADVRAGSIDVVVDEQKVVAREYLLELLKKDGPQRFSKLADALLEAFMLRETNVKDLCVDLARDGEIDRTWGNGNRKPGDGSRIELRAAESV